MIHRSGRRQTSYPRVDCHLALPHLDGWCVCLIHCTAAILVQYATKHMKSRIAVSKAKARSIHHPQDTSPSAVKTERLRQYIYAVGPSNLDFSRGPSPWPASRRLRRTREVRDECRTRCMLVDDSERKRAPQSKATHTTSKSRLTGFEKGQKPTEEYEAMILTGPTKMTMKLIIEITNHRRASVGAEDADYHGDG